MFTRTVVARPQGGRTGGIHLSTGVGRPGPRSRCGVAPAARTAWLGRSWRCGSNYSAGREVGEDRHRRRRLGRGGVAFAAQPAWPARPVRSPAPRSQPRRSGGRSPSSAASCAPVRTPGAPTPTPARNRWRRSDLPGHRRSRDGGGSRRPPAWSAGTGRDRDRATRRSRSTTALDAAAVDACAARRRRCSDRRREALRRRRRRGAGPAGPRRLRLRLRDRTLDDVPWTEASRAPRCRGAGRPRVCGRREDRRARHEPGHRRGIRPAERTVAGDSPRAGESAAAPLRRPSVDGCSRPEARSPEERSEPCTPTRRARGAGRSCRTCERRATASASSGGAVARTRSRAARSPG